MNAKIYVGNLSYNIENSDLENLFSEVGSVVNVNVVRDRDTGRARGFGFVEMQSKDDADKAINDLHQRDFMGRALVVNMARAERSETNYRF
ncbi:hypothetical protein [Bacteriovorax sp. DB6_IX]|uniref:RNA recognition motif domain-containing protein n=1 Tax=Bacteriovorax sp. DB6_IX TaxID=1353530 RepID=UPI00038A506A|nr:hypothetical protein [Bacteriovorax sp. DB6_IX]EQC51830.1 hypothetical protein M901_2691 [Bacteriovorax sp. DB6_IX]